MLLSSKNDEYDGIKTFEVYSSDMYIMYSQYYLQTNKNINLCYGIYCRKSVTN